MRCWATLWPASTTEQNSRLGKILPRISINMDSLTNKSRAMRDKSLDRSPEGPPNAALYLPESPSEKLHLTRNDCASPKNTEKQIKRKMRCRQWTITLLTVLPSIPDTHHPRIHPIRHSPWTSGNRKNKSQPLNYGALSRNTTRMWRGEGRSKWGGNSMKGRKQWPWRLRDDEMRRILMIEDWTRGEVFKN